MGNKFEMAHLITSGTLLVYVVARVFSVDCKCIKSLHSSSYKKKTQNMYFFYKIILMITVGNID